MLSSPPTISQEEQEDGDEEDNDEESEQSDSGSSTKSDDSSEKDQDTDEKDEVSVEDLAVVRATDDIEAEIKMNERPYPAQVMYENRNILNLGGNIWRLNNFVNYTVLPENNVNCFFQNRAQYWRLANKDVEFDKLEKCDCCGFGYMPQGNSNDNSRGQFANAGGAKNPITDSLKMFLKNNYNSVDQQNPVAPSMANVQHQQQPIMNAIHHGGNAGQQGYNNNMNNKRMYNNNAPYAAYQVIQQQQQPPQQYQNNQNAYFGNGNNNAAGYNGTALALLNLMKSSRNVSGAAFQATMNNSSRYYNNMNTSNNGYGLYKQF